MNSIQVEPKSRKHEPRFIFNDGDTEIIFINSYSGVEYVYINGQEVYSQRKISKKSAVEIEYDSNVYRFEIDVKNALLGPVICAFYKNNNMITAKKMVFVNIAKYYSFITLLVIFLLFMVINYDQSIILFLGVSIVIYGIGRILFPIRADYSEIK